MAKTLQRNLLFRSGIEEEQKPDADASDNDEIYPDDWAFILDGYSKLYKHLNPDTCEVDRIVKFILDANIPVRGVNILNLKKTALEHPGYVKAKYVSQQSGHGQLQQRTTAVGI